MKESQEELQKEHDEAVVKMKPGVAITRAEFVAIAAWVISDDVTDDETGDFADTANNCAAKDWTALEAKWAWLSTVVRFYNFSPDGRCKKMAGKSVQLLNNYTCRFACQV